VYESAFFSHPHQHLLVVVLLMIAILTGVRWNLSVGLIYISFMARDGEHFFCACVCVCVVFFFFFWPFGLLPLKKYCLVQFPTSLLVH
jgi:hypothetical protein